MFFLIFWIQIADSVEDTYQEFSIWLFCGGAMCAVALGGWVAPRIPELLGYAPRTLRRRSRL